ncbi:uncharacterized protein HKW66_Vig0215850 [Vigna angularis]|uniref:Uncharacterized protein n=1 Tax=Phaseolus angularis TaxID=3914 RepID=A0A8T0JGR2_PHAAN|nr:uncharacterized protein HKW66_Vig0215850 [Vigna angularis]
METSSSSLFLEKSIRCGSMLAREARMGPESWCWDSTRLGPGLLNDPKESEIGPVSLFRSRRKDNRLGNWESELARFLSLFLKNELLVGTNIDLRTKIDELEEPLNRALSEKDATTQELVAHKNSLAELNDLQSKSTQIQSANESRIL